MSIWGKVLGSVGGFALGGPIGGLLGAMAGHAVDRFRDNTVAAESNGPQTEPRPQEPRPHQGTRQVAFTIGVVVLGAKMAKADGTVTRDEVEAFKQIFKIPNDEMRKVGKLFDRSRQDAKGFEPYAEQIADIFRDDKAILEELLNGLFHIARADGRVSPAELVYLETVARIFGFSQSEWDRIKAPNVPPDKYDPYQVLGVDPAASDAEIKSAHRRLVMKNHPDKLMAQGLPQEFLDLANEKLAAINAAYDEIKRRRD